MASAGAQFELECPPGVAPGQEYEQMVDWQKIETDLPPPPPATLIRAQVGSSKSAVSMSIELDADTLLLVDQMPGGACHEAQLVGCIVEQPKRDGATAAVVSLNIYLATPSSQGEKKYLLTFANVDEMEAWYQVFTNFSLMVAR